MKREGTAFEAWFISLSTLAVANTISTTWIATLGVIVAIYWFCIAIGRTEIWQAYWRGLTGK